MNTCRHVPDGPYKWPLGQRGTLQWHKMYCKKCSALLECHVYNPKPPPQVDQLAELGYSEKASPNLTGEPGNECNSAVAFLCGDPMPADCDVGDRAVVGTPQGVVLPFPS